MYKYIPELGDLDGDGDYDMLIGSYDGQNYGFENNGTFINPSWKRRSEWDAPSVGRMSAPAFADLDGDGDLDLLVGNYSSVTAYENNGTSTNLSWNRKPEWDGSSIGSIHIPALADLDNDGDYDMVIGDQDNRIIYAHENNGSRTSPSWNRREDWEISVGLNHLSPAFMDRDNDGDNDLFIGTGAGFTYAYENNGSINSPSWNRRSDWDLADIGDYSAPTFGDLTGDGAPDLILGEYRALYGYAAEITYPLNPSVDAGGDGDAQWSYVGAFNETIITPDFSSELNEYLSGCPGDGECEIPLVFFSASPGRLKLSITIEYIDITPPIITIDSPQNRTIASTIIDLKVSANEATETWWYSLNSGANTTFTPNTTITADIGPNNIVVYANDTAGNIGSATVWFTVEEIDTHAPIITINSPPNLTIRESTPVLRVTELEDNPDTTWYSIDGGQNTTGVINETSFEIVVSKVYNSGFKDDSLGWVASDWGWGGGVLSITALESHSGKKSYNYTKFGQHRLMTITSDYITVNSDTEYRIGLWYKGTDSWSNGGNPSYGIKLEVIEYNSTNDAINTVSDIVPISKLDWYNYNYTFITKPSTVKVKVRIQDSYAYASNGFPISFFFDDVFLSLDNGPHYINVYANDTAGNFNSSTAYFTVNTTQPWIIDDVQTISNKVITLNGNLIIRNGGSLTLNNATLRMNVTYNGQYKIWAMNGSTLTIDNNSVITNGDYQSTHFLFLVDTGASFSMKNSELHHSGYYDPEKCSRSYFVYTTCGLRIKTPNVILDNNWISDNYVGIVLDQGSDHSTIINNNMSNNQVHGAFFSKSNHNVFSNNIFQSNGGSGVWGLASTNNTFENNIALNNKGQTIIPYETTLHNGGLFLPGDSYSKVINNTVIGNNIGGIVLDPGSSYSIAEHNYIENNPMGLILGTWVSHSIVSNNIIVNSGIRGITLEGANINNTIIHNSVLNGGTGVFLWSYAGPPIQQNVIKNNTIVAYDIGIRFLTANDNVIRDNLILNNNIGISLYRSSNNTFFHNNLINNSIQAQDDSPPSNKWHHPTLLEGNYWSNYFGLDDGSGTGKHAIAGDGIGDTLIPHPSSDYDYYPFVNQNGWTGQDITPPLVFLYSPVNTTYNTSLIGLEVLANEIINAWWYSLNSGVNTSFIPNTTIKAVNGSNRLDVFALDNAGNVGLATVHFTVLETPKTMKEGVLADLEALKASTSKTQSLKEIDIAGTVAFSSDR